VFLALREGLWCWRALNFDPVNFRRAATTIANFDNHGTINLTLGGDAQNGGTQSVSDAGGDTLAVSNCGVIVDTDLTAFSGGTAFDAATLSTAEADFAAAVDLTGKPGQYSFVVDSNQGAAIYEMHVTGGTVDGVQLIGVTASVTAAHLAGHIA